MRCLQMSTASRPHSAPLFVIPPDPVLSACDRKFVIPSLPAFRRTAAKLVILSKPASGRSSEGSAFACAPPNLSLGALHFAHSNVSHSTHGATVLLVFPIKSLKILLSGSTVVRTKPDFFKSNFSRNARRPRLAFPRVSRRTRCSANRPAKVSVPRVGGRYENE
jgi:hypothetical protein